MALPGILLLFIALSKNVVSEQNELLVQTSSGPVEGQRIEAPYSKELVKFLGIPYALPPVGQLRFSPPVEVRPSIEVIRAHNMSKSCVQLWDERFPGIDWVPFIGNQSEDCLYLNIWVPSPRPSKAAVMIFFHGGGYMFGTSTEHCDGDVIATQGVIVVSMNYRLNVFGFMAYDPLEVPGNVGLMDQAMAMQWVKNNIENFGGDPERVTIFGTSAGGGSVGHHLLIPASRGLFQRAILESGASSNPWSYCNKDFARNISERVIQQLGCQQTNRVAVIACLRSKSESELRTVASISSPDPTKVFTFVPVIDGHYYPSEPRVMLASGASDGNVSVLLGAAVDESIMLATLGFLGPLNLTGDPLISQEDFTNTISWILSTTKHSKVITEIQKAYIDSVRGMNWRRAFVEFTSDFWFMCGIAETADSQARAGSDVYFYELNFKPFYSMSPAWCGATHCDEMLMIFGYLIRNRLHTTYPKEVEMSERLIAYWTRFAKNGNPNSDGSKDWPKYTETGRKYLALDLTSQIRSGIRLRHCRFVRERLPGLLSCSHPQQLVRWQETILLQHYNV